MVEVAQELKRGNVTIIVMTLLLVIVGIAVPLASRYLIGNEVRTIVAQEVIPLLEENIEFSKANAQSIDAINDANMLDLRDKAIIAYNSKIFTIDDLQPLTQNGLAVRNGLQVPEIRQALFTLDPERTLLFEEYFAGQ